jgi:hypothetical protein
MALWNEWSDWEEDTHIGHANNQLLDVPVNSRSAGDTPRWRSIEFASNEPSVPRQDGVGSTGRRHFSECSVAVCTENSDSGVSMV